MLTERNVWLGATTTAIGILLLLLLETPTQRRVRATPRIDDNVLAAIYGCTPAPTSGQKQLFAFIPGRGARRVNLR